MPSISLEDVSVSFPIYSAATRSLKNSLLESATGGQICSAAGSSRISVVQALQDINLRLRSGDRIGLVGHNGAGKTTLLRVLAGIYEPNAGRVSVAGSTVPLFDINLGMDPESTGYENIIRRGLYLGLTRAQIRARLDEIADFTELGGFLDLPIRTYSAGMRMRLAFAVSTSIAPDILLIDEGIGAGDAAFLRKANERLRRFTEQVSIIVLSSHSEQLITQMCQQALLLQHGRIIGSGPTAEVLAQYRTIREAATQAGAARAKAPPSAPGAAASKPPAKITPPAPVAAAGKPPAKITPPVPVATTPAVAASSLSAKDRALPAPAGVARPRPPAGSSDQASAASAEARPQPAASRPSPAAGQPEAVPDMAHWARALARLIQEHGWTNADVAQLVKRAQTLTEQDRLVGEARLIDLLLQLLIWHYRESERVETRRVLIDEARFQIERLIEANGAITQVLSTALAGAYATASAVAARYLGVRRDSLPPVCPVPLSLVLDRSWLPGQPPSEHERLDG